MVMLFDLLPTLHDFITQGIILLRTSLCVSLLLTVCILEALVLFLELLNLLKFTPLETFFWRDFSTCIFFVD